MTRANVQFGEVAEILPGRYLPAERYDPLGDFTIFGSNTIMGRAREPLYGGPVISFARVGSNAGAVMFSAAPCWINNNAAGIRARPPNDTRFIYYFLRGVDPLSIRQGSGQPFVPNSALNALHVCLPSPAEQRAIASILGALDDKIDFNRRMNETLEAMARALFKSWFIDFDPVRAKAEGRQPAGMDAETAALFPSEFEGELPKGWRWGTLTDLARVNELTYGASTLPPLFSYLDISTVMRGHASDVQVLTPAAAPSRARRMLRPGDTLLSMVRPDRGAYFLVTGRTDDLVASTGFAVLTPKEGDREFVYLSFTSNDVLKGLGRSADGGAYPAVNQGIVERLSAVVPPTTIRKAFSRSTGAIFDRIAACDRESRTLAALRDALLPKLMSGELHVQNAEALIEEAT